MQHLDEGTVHAWLDGALSESDAAAVAQHVAECSECSSMVAEARGMIAGAARIVSALDHVPGNVIPATIPIRPRQNSLWRQLRLTPARAALAATILVAVASVLTVRGDKSQKGFQDAMTAASAPMAPQPQERDSLKQLVPPAQSKPQTAREVPKRQEQRQQQSQRAAADVATPVASGAASGARRDEKLAKSVIADSAATTGRVLAEAARRREATTPVAAANQVAAAPPVAPPTVAVVAADSSRRRVADSISRNADQSFSRRAADSRDVRPTALQLTDVTTSTFEGCYQLDSDSLRTATGLPARFALQQAPDNSPNRAQNVVRAVSPAGRVDSILRRSSWRVITPALARVSLDTTSVLQPLTIRLTNGAVLGQLNSAGPVSLTRLACRP